VGKRKHCLLLPVTTGVVQRLWVSFQGNAKLYALGRLQERTMRGIGEIECFSEVKIVHLTAGWDEVAFARWSGVGSWCKPFRRWGRGSRQCSGL